MVVQILNSKSEFDNIDTKEIFIHLNKLETYMIMPDYIRMSDVLMYEIKPIVEQWRNIVT